METISLETLRRELSRIIGRVYYGREAFIVEVYGKPAAVLLNIGDFQRLRALENQIAQETLSLSEALGVIRGKISQSPWPDSSREAVRRMLERREQVGTGSISAADLVAEGRRGREAACGW